PVYNRPTATSLAGPGWTQERWIHTAARLGIRVRSLRTHVGTAAQPDGPLVPTIVRVVGRRRFGPPELAERAARLPAAADVGMRETFFDSDQPGAALMCASAWPGLEDPDVTDAVAELLEVSAC